MDSPCLRGRGTCVTSPVRPSGSAVCQRVSVRGAPTLRVKVAGGDDVVDRICLAHPVHPSALPSHVAPPTMTFASPGSPPAHPTRAGSPALAQTNKCSARRRRAGRRRSANVSPPGRRTRTYSQQHNRPLAIRLQGWHRREKCIV